uniref:Nudix hydrolase domain-containing protein n=1 Tax=Haemonchus contortus TaxID=6289 RepID=A0A7I4Z4D8_HAECO
MSLETERTAKANEVKSARSTTAIEQNVTDLKTRNADHEMTGLNRVIESKTTHRTNEDMLALITAIDELNRPRRPRRPYTNETNSRNISASKSTSLKAVRTAKANEMKRARSTTAIKQNQTDLKTRNADHELTGLNRARSTKEPYKENSFRDVVMYTKNLPPEMVEESRFASVISKFFNEWKEKGLNAAWVYISLQDSHVVPHLAKLGFDFFHAAKGELAMTCWLSDKPSSLPLTTSSHYTVSGMVLDETGRVLMVRDQHRKSVWKFPGGAPLQGETLFATAERKVKEETGVVAKGEAVISLGQKLKTKFNGSCALFFTCRMKFVRDVDRVQNDEIVAVKWFTR